MKRHRRGGNRENVHRTNRHSAAHAVRTTSRPESSSSCQASRRRSDQLARPRAAMLMIFIFQIFSSAMLVFAFLRFSFMLSIPWLYPFSTAPSDIAAICCLLPPPLSPPPALDAR